MIRRQCPPYNLEYGTYVLDTDGEIAVVVPYRNRKHWVILDDDVERTINNANINLIEYEYKRKNGNFIFKRKLISSKSKKDPTRHRKKEVTYVNVNKTRYPKYVGKIAGQDINEEDEEYDSDDMREVEIYRRRNDDYEDDYTDDDEDDYTDDDEDEGDFDDDDDDFRFRASTPRKTRTKMRVIKSTIQDCPPYEEKPKKPKSKFVKQGKYYIRPPKEDKCIEKYEEKHCDNDYKPEYYQDYISDTEVSSPNPCIDNEIGDTLQATIKDNKNIELRGKPVKRQRLRKYTSVKNSAYKKSRKDVDKKEKMYKETVHSKYKPRPPMPIKRHEEKYMDEHTDESDEEKYEYIGSQDTDTGSEESFDSEEFADFIEDDEEDGYFEHKY